MPVIKVWCLPSGQTEDDLNRLHQAIVKAVVSVSELGLKDQNDMTCLFPPDLMKYGLGEEIIIEIGGLFRKPERTQEIRQRLAENVGRAVSGFYPKAKTECFVTTFVTTIDSSNGFWTSAKSAPAEEELFDDGHNFFDGVERGSRDPNK